MFPNQLCSLRKVWPEPKFYRTNCIIRPNDSTKGFQEQKLYKQTKTIKLQFVSQETNKEKRKKNTKNVTALEFKCWSNCKLQNTLEFSSEQNISTLIWCWDKCIKHSFLTPNLIRMFSSPVCLKFGWPKHSWKEMS